MYSANQQIMEGFGVIRFNEKFLRTSKARALFEPVECTLTRTVAAEIDATGGILEARDRVIGFSYQGEEISIPLHHWQDNIAPLIPHFFVRGERILV
jgi:hypothetical protein